MVSTSSSHRTRGTDEPGTRRATFTVSDRGAVIPAEDLPHICTLYYRAYNAITHRGGTGVGLASAKSIIEEHGGTLDIESERGRGTAVTVCLPRP